MTDDASRRPAICLNMIVRNEAHVVTELLDSVAPYISSWVIVDTGSNDGTQDLIRTHMGRLGIRGELHERPWRDFGQNRTEALTLAQAHGDYILVLDADDTIVGAPDFTRLSADVYQIRFRVTGDQQSGSHSVSWRPQIFRNGLRIRYVGATHEQIHCDDPYVIKRLEGDYHVEYRRLGARSLDSQTYARDRDLLLAAVKRNPNDAQSVLHLAQAYFLLGDFANARKWYERRTEMGGSNEYVFHAMCQAASSMSHLGAPWLEVQDRLLKAWEIRPTRAETLYTLAAGYRGKGRYWMAYLLAKVAAEIPFPEHDELLVNSDIYAFGAIAELAASANAIGKHAEAFALFRRLLARPELPDDHRQGIARNRDVCAQAMADAASAYPDAVVRRLVSGLHRATVVVTLVAGSDLATTEKTLNTFLQCCTDVASVDRFLVFDAGLSVDDRAFLQERYGFVSFVNSVPEDGPGSRLGLIRAQVDGRYWLHLGHGWEFFAPENYIARLTTVLDTEAQVFQVGINFADATTMTGTCAAEQTVRRTPDGERYTLADRISHGPAMFDIARLDEAGGVPSTDGDPIAELGQCAAAIGLRTATLDEVFCVGPR